MHRAAMVPTIAMDPIMKFFLSLVLVDGLSSSFHLPIYILTKLLPSFFEIELTDIKRGSFNY